MAAPGKKKLPPLSPEPSGPTPYHSISIPKATARRDRAETAPGSSSLHKKKPPIMPRKKSLKGSEAVSTAAGELARTVGGAGKETEYMEVIL